jgi:ribokinase
VVALTVEAKTVNLGHPKLMVVGSSNTDMVVKTSHLPRPGETVLGGKFVMVAGGKGANQAVAAARLGGRVTFVCRLGQDVFGDQSLENFRREGLDVSYIARDAREPSGVALIYVDGSGENEIVVAPGANSKLSPEDVDRAADCLSDCNSVVLQMEVPLETVIHAAQLARDRGARVILNPAPMPADGLPKSLLRNVDILVPNETETRILLGLDETEPVDEDALRRLLDLGARQAVVTLGARGVMATTPEGVRHIASPQVQAVDTTAAGDAFVGALAVALGSELDLVDACQLAANAASLSVTRMGAQSSLPTADELLRFYQAK